MLIPMSHARSGKRRHRSLGIMHIRRLHEGAHNRPGNGEQREADRRKLRHLDGPCFRHGLGMHEFPVFDRTGDILPAIFIHGSQYRDGEGLADFYREPLRAGLADLSRSVVDNGGKPDEGGKPD
jgi:hypothetical protein